ncbi:MAG: efflux transporter outer membrane subunit, partial [Maricaulaceae bacterium]
RRRPRVNVPRSTPFRALIGAGALALGGCLVGPDYAPPATEEVASTGFGQSPGADANPGQPAALWWRRFNDDELSTLVTLALAENRDLRTAVANLNGSRALLGLERLELFPRAQVDGAFTRSRPSAAGLGAALPFLEEGLEAFDDQSLIDLGLSASWEADFFGRVRRSIEAARADLQEAAFLYQNAAVLVASDVALAYVDLRGAQLQLAVAAQNAENQLATLDLTERLQEGGRATALDVARAQAQYETTLASVPPLEAAAATAVHRLAVLTGRAPATLRDMTATPSTLPVPLAEILIGDPKGLLQRRPDIRAAERALAAETARIGVATADFFPQVSFSGAFGISSATLTNFGTIPSIDFNFGPQITWAGFDLPRVRARIRAADAQAEAALAVYEQTVLLALEQTENAFVAYNRESERLDRLERVVEASAEAARLAQLRYENGVDDFLDVLDAQRTLLEAETLLADSQTARLRNLVAIYRALGGGWEAIAARPEAGDLPAS